MQADAGKRCRDEGDGREKCPGPATPAMRPATTMKARWSSPITG